METRFIESEEIKTIEERNNGYKDIKPMKITENDLEMSDKDLFTKARKNASKLDSFELIDDFDKIEIEDTELTTKADMVIFQEGDKYIRVKGGIRKTGKSYIITKNGKSILVSCGNSQLFLIS